MDHRRPFVVGDHADLDRFGAGGGADEHRDSVVVGLESSPMMSKCVQHVVVADTVLPGARLDVQADSLRNRTIIVNTC